MVKVFNTLSKKKDILKKGKINIFVCGITPYDFAHLGHARTYIAFDAIVKYLKTAGFGVFYLQNVTDVDDKIINRAKELGESAQAVARLFEKEYRKDMKSLRVTSVNKYARATDHIKEIVGQIQRLLKKGYAYQTEDGIYYDIKKFKEYGKLSGRTTEQAEDGVSRIDESVKKRNKGDFALWKLSRPGEPTWSFASAQDGPTVQMDGRPGWHIEDTAITEKYFGAQYDIHGGGRDLIFPHHEAEIAQMEGISGKKPLAKYWMHSGFLTIKGAKMSKSLGNFITIRDFLKSRSARLLRFFVLKTHYRSPIDYSEKLEEQSLQELERIDEFVDKLKGKFPAAGRQISNFKSDFQKAMADDFNAPEAIAVVFNLIKEGNILLSQNKLSKKDAKAILSFFKDADKIFNFIFWGKEKQEKIPSEVMQLVQKREECRKQQQWQKADELRIAIQRKGWLLEDTKNGSRLKPSKLAKSQ